MSELLARTALLFATFSVLSFVSNLLRFRRAPDCGPTPDRLPNVSVLIPARNEEAGIGETLQCVLANQAATLEVVVLDDQSQDRTCQIVEQFMAVDPRVRLIRGGPLPRGWCGKQYACHQLASRAKYDAFLFLDADVRLSQQAICRCLTQWASADVDLLSGFPRQVVGSLGEALLIPMMYLILLTYLPFGRMRRSRSPAASAGCGQLFLTSRLAYQRSGGHRAIQSSLHDGVTLPRAYRRAGLRTDLFDASDIACCRMYPGFLATCRGLTKNAHEGMANFRLIVPATSLLLLGYLLPASVAAYFLLTRHLDRGFMTALVAATLSYLPRLLTAARFDRSWLAASLFPLSIVLFLALQWIAFARYLFGSQSSWRGRSYSTTTA